jgi:hypothetical protein
MKELDHQNGNQSCPNVDEESVVTGLREFRHLQVLLKSLKEEFDSPAVVVDS